MTNCVQFEGFGQEAMTALIETLFLKFQKCLGIARKEYKPSVMGEENQDTVTITIAQSEGEVAANTVVDVAAATEAVAAVAANPTGTSLDDSVDEGDHGDEDSATEGLGEAKPELTAQQRKAAAVGKRGQTGRKKSGRGAGEEEEAVGEDKVVKILPNLIIVPPGGKPPVGTLNTAPVAVPKVLPKILPKPLYGGGGGIGANSGMLPGGSEGGAGGGGMLTGATTAPSYLMPTGTKTTVVTPAVVEDLSCHLCNKVGLGVCTGRRSNACRLYFYLFVYVC